VVNEEHEILVFLERWASFVLTGVPGTFAASTWSIDVLDPGW
jgi:hypothetical protein